MTDTPTKRVRITLPKPTRYQEDAIFSDVRGVIIEATTKAGKTVGCLWWLLTQAAGLGRDNRQYWWVAPIYEQAEIAFRRCKALWASTDPQREHWDSNESKLTISLCNGATIRFKGADKPDSLYGDDVFGAVMDEATRCKEEAWHALRTTLTATRAPVRIIGNIKGRHNWAYRLARQVEKGDLPGWKYAKITCYDAVKAGIISKDEVDAARRELPESVFRELYEGVPSDDGSNPFGLSHIAACVKPMASTAPAVYGVDLAKSNDWSVVIGLDNQGDICHFERWQSPWRDTKRRIVSIVGETPALVDSTGVGDAVLEDIQAECPLVEGYKFTNTSKQQLMEGLAIGIQQRETSVLEGIHKLELESFEWQFSRTGRVTYSAPEGQTDDTVCGHALAKRKLGSRQPLELVGSYARTPPPSPQERVDSLNEQSGPSYDKLREDEEWGWQRAGDGRW